jgi:hypothetical protein
VEQDDRETAGKNARSERNWACRKTESRADERNQLDVAAPETASRDEGDACEDDGAKRRGKRGFHERLKPFDGRSGQDGDQRRQRHQVGHAVSKKVGGATDHQRCGGHRCRERVERIESNGCQQQEKRHTPPESATEVFRPRSGLPWQHADLRESRVTGRDYGWRDAEPPNQVLGCDGEGQPGGERDEGQEHQVLIGLTASNRNRVWA